MSRITFVAALSLALALGRSIYASVNFTEDFSTNPSNTWTFGIGAADPSTNRFVWNSTASAAYTGDAIGALDVHLDSSLPTVRFQRPLGVTLTDTNNFTLTVRFSFNVTSAPADQDMQIAFGLVNSNNTLTGGNRTGTTGIYTDDDTFNTVEFNYFPNANPWDPTLTPVVFGAQRPGVDAFGNFIGLFGYDSSLGTHTNGITALPQSVTLQASLIYNGTTKQLTLTMCRVNVDGSLTLLDTGLPALNLTVPGPFSQYYTNASYAVDSLAIMAYHDGFTTTNDPSLVADLIFQRLSFSASTPELPSYVSINISSTNVLLAFPTASNSLYYVQSSTNLVSGSWSTIASNIVGTGGIVTNIHVGAATVPSRFYRIGLAAP